MKENHTGERRKVGNAVRYIEHPYHYFLELLLSVREFGDLFCEKIRYLVRVFHWSGPKFLLILASMEQHILFDVTARWLFSAAGWGDDATEIKDGTPASLTF